MSGRQSFCHKNIDLSVTLSGQVVLKGRFAGPTFMTPEQLTDWKDAVKNAKGSWEKSRPPNCARATTHPACSGTLISHFFYNKIAQIKL